ncbi:ATP-binding protein [Mariniphaga sp.]|uniref:hybrid sensor histidine kinase/response regulator n=1 Tax=Mariniphaga sp. TaxID=1954475 RepID=UPI0035645273
MAKLRIEVQVTLLAVIIAGSVIATGYLAYKSLSNIVYSIQQETTPDYQLFIIKDIASDLAAIENSVRLYVLTNEEQNLKPYHQTGEAVRNKLKNLQTNYSTEYASVVDSFHNLALEKLDIWQGILDLHNSSLNNEPTFSEIYSQLEVTQVDTIITETREKGFLKGILGKRKVIVDTLLVEKNLERTQLRNEIQDIESSIKEKDSQINILESKLIERNGEIGNSLNQLVQWGERYESNKRISKIEEAHRLAQITYKRLAMFSAAAMVLLLAVIFLLFNYQRKARAYQRALKKAKEEAENLALAKEQFAANVSHEMRTPVNAIYSMAEQLQTQGRGESHQKQLAVLAHSANHLKSIINDTLDFSKIQAKKLSLDAVHFSPASVFEEVAGVQEAEAKNKGIELIYNQKSTLPDALLGDPLRLKQILINLLGNAGKFTETGKVELHVKTEPESAKKIWLHFKVADTGIGISKENQQIIFDEFVQTENLSGKKYSGTGLGLAIVKKLVELQNGSISVESEPGVGTTMSVSIPYLPGEKSKIVHETFFAPEIPAHFKNRKVLIADDEDFNRFVLMNILDKWGVKYQEAKNGEEAIHLAMENNFDVIFMDMRMPKRNGLEAAQEILKKKSDSCIIAVTASDRTADQEASKKAGMAGFLVKPFSEKELFDVVSQFWNNELSAKNVDTVPKINPDELEKIAVSDPGFFKEMVLLYFKTSKDGLKIMEKAVAEKNWETVSETAHKMAAPTKHFKAENLYKKLKSLENISETNADENEIAELFTSVKSETAEVIAFLELYLTNWEMKQK